MNALTLKFPDLVKTIGPLYTDDKLSGWVSSVVYRYKGSEIASITFTEIESTNKVLLNFGLISVIGFGLISIPFASIIGFSSGNPSRLEKSWSEIPKYILLFD